MSWKAEYSQGVNIKETPTGFSFAFPASPGHVNLIGRDHGAIPLTATITISYKISGKAKFKSLDPAPAPPGLKPNFRPMLFNGDWYDMNGRWWPTDANCAFLVADNQTLTYTVKLKPSLWSNVQGKQNGPVFKAFLKKVKRFYFAFGGGNSFSHGISDGGARLEITSVKIQ